MKTASSSIEMNFANNYMTPIDVLSEMSEDATLEQNNRGWFNPIPEILDQSYTVYNTAFQFYHRFKFGPHQSARVIQHRIPKYIWKNYFKFTVERNPYDKMASMYFMNWGKNGTDRPGKTFEDWVKRGKNFPVNYPLYTWKDRLLVDRVVRFEKLNEELRQVYKELGVPFNGLQEKAKAGFRNNMPYRELHTSYTRQKTSEVFQKEIELMEYSF